MPMRNMGIFSSMLTADFMGNGGSAITGPIGNGKDTSWRTSRRALGIRSRNSRRKAKRMARAK